MKKLFAILGLSAVAFSSVGFMAACDEPPKMKENSSIEITESMVEMNVGEERRLSLRTAPLDAEDKTVEWTSSNEGVASVKDGLVKAKSAGDSTITVKGYGKSSSCQVKVTE